MPTMLDTRGAVTTDRRSRVATNGRSRYSEWARSGTVPAVESSDQLLAARLAAGDERALTDVFDTLASAVYAAAVHVLGESAAAQDVVQDVFVELWRRPQRYDPTRGSLRT